MAADETDVVAERQQLVLDRLDQRVVVAAGNIAAADRTVEQHVADMGKAHFPAEIYDAARRMAGAMQDVEAQLADRDPVALMKPAVRRKIAHACHAKPRAAHHYIVEQEFVGHVRAFDRHLERVAQLGGAADMIDMAVGQPDLLHSDVRLLDRGLNFRNVAAGVDHHGFPGGLAPDQGAVLLEQRHRDDDGAGFGLGFGFLGHVSTLPVFYAPPRARLKHFDRDRIGRGTRLGLGSAISGAFSRHCSALSCRCRRPCAGCRPEPVSGCGVTEGQRDLRERFPKMNPRDKFWWRHGIFYQIYPRSFQDTNADGVGDINGIIERLPYLQSLGVDAIWLSPISPSPMADFGYDIADYTGVDPLFGTMADFDKLVKAAHAGGLKLILDLVPNHTSDQHPWFVESRASRDNPKRDWYIWRDPAADGGPPNNWLSEFGGSAWPYDATPRQYYYHAFLAQQPDLNWRNPEARHAIYEVMRFWLRKGVDGFRVDVIWHLIKDPEFRDNPPNPHYREGRPPHERILPLHSTDQAEVHDVIAQMRRVVDEFDSRVLIGEIYLPPQRLVSYYGKNLAGAHLPFNFALLSAPWNAREIEKIVFEYESVLPVGAWPNWVLGNHDRPRVASRVGQAQARVAAMLLLTLRGTPTLYYGDEIGMHQVAIAPEQVRDPFEKNVPAIGVGRDGCRPPMQWSAVPHAGFSTAGPWLPLPDDFVHENVANLEADSRSILCLYKALIELRRQCSPLVSGDYVPIAAQGDLLLYRRRQEGKAVVIALNLGAEPISMTSDAAGLAGEILLSTMLDRKGERIAGTLDLRGNEGVIIG